MQSTEINKVIKYADDLYIITETESVHCYLILGKEKAVFFDCGYGYEDVQPLIKEITNLPVMLVLSHGDPDHGLGTAHFRDVWMHELDVGKLLWNDNEDMKQRAYEYRIKKMPHLKDIIDKEAFLSSSILGNVQIHFLRDKDVIDLGGTRLQVIHTPGHSYGHIMLLDKESKRLFSGDQITSHNIWYFSSSDQQAPFSTAMASMNKILDQRNEFTEIFSAHGEIPIGIEYVKDFYECLENELKVNYQNDSLFQSFVGDGYQHFYKTVNLIYSDERLSELVGHTIKRVKKGD